MLSPTGGAVRKRARGHKRSKSTFQSTIAAAEHPDEDEEEVDIPSNRGAPTRDENELLSRMINIIKRYEVGVQKLNRLRFEALREDRADTGLVTKDFFKQMQKRFGMSVSSADQRDMFGFFQIGIQ